MPKESSRNRGSKRGTITVELAVSVNLLVLLMVGASDFARVFFNSITVANASGTGSFYGAQNTIKAAGLTAIESKASDDAGDLYGVTATATLYCDCPDGSGGSFIECTELVCDSYGTPRVYSKTVVEQGFQSLFPWPGIPDQVVVNRETFMRVQ